VLRDHDIIYFSCLDWEPGRQRPQQIALELATVNRVLYVEPMISLVSQLERLVRQEGARPLMPALRQIHSALFLYTPPSFLPFSLRNERLNSVNKTLLLRSIRKTMGALRFRRPIVAVSHPSHHEVVGRLDEEVSFYDCMDHYTLLPDKRANPTVLAAMEQKLLEKVDLIFVTSQRLQDGIAACRGKGALVRNGADLAHFDAYAARSGRTVPELSCIPRPIVGYIGVVGSWFDADAVAFLAGSRPDLSVVLVGPVQDRRITRKLRGFRNVHLLGPKPYLDLPLYLDAFAVCLIPFQVNDLTRAINPVKLYEYLASGKPVVAAELDEIKRYEDLVSIYATRGELVEQVERALGAQDPEIVRLRVQVARENTWGRRVEELGTAIARYLALDAHARVLERDGRRERA